MVVVLLVHCWLEVVVEVASQDPQGLLELHLAWEVVACYPWEEGDLQVDQAWEDGFPWGVEVDHPLEEVHPYWEVGDHPYVLEEEVHQCLEAHPLAEVAHPCVLGVVGHYPGAHPFVEEVHPYALGEEAHQCLEDHP